MLSTSNYKSLLPLEEIFHGTKSSQKFCKSEVPDQILETKSYSLKHQHTVRTCVLLGFNFQTTFNKSLI